MALNRDLRTYYIEGKKVAKIFVKVFLVMFLLQKTMEQDEWNGVQQAVHNLLLL